MGLPDNSLLKCFDAWYEFNTSSKYGNHDTRFADKLVRDAVGFGFMFSQKEIEAQLAEKDLELETYEEASMITIRKYEDELQSVKKDHDRVIADAVAEEREACARVAEGGSFLHDEAPDARFGKACAKAIRMRSNV